MLLTFHDFKLHHAVVWLRIFFLLQDLTDMPNCAYLLIFQGTLESLWDGCGLISSSLIHGEL